MIIVAISLDTQHRLLPSKCFNSPIIQEKALGNRDKYGRRVARSQGAPVRHLATAVLFPSAKCLFSGLVPVVRCTYTLVSPYSVCVAGYYHLCGASFIWAFVEGRAAAGGSSASHGTGSSVPRQSTSGKICSRSAREVLWPRPGAGARSGRAHVSGPALYDGYGGPCCGSLGCAGSVVGMSVSP